MSNKLKIFCCIALLPALLVLGHDIYVALFGQQDVTHAVGALEDLDIQPREFHLSDTGYLWTTYLPDSYKSFRANMDDGPVKDFIIFILKQWAILIALVPGIISASLVALLIRSKDDKFTPVTKYKRK